MDPAARDVGDVGHLAKGGAANALAAAVATGAGLLIVVVAGRSMSPAEYATFAAVWGLMFGTASVVSALEPEMARQHALAAGPVDRAQVSATLIVGATAASAVLLLLVVLGHELRVDSVAVGGLAVASAGLFAAMFSARGYLAGSLRLAGLAWMTFSEAFVRLAVVLLALFLSVPPVPAFAGAALASACVGLPILMRSARRVAGQFSLVGTLRRLGTLMVGNAMAATLVTGAPVLVGLAMAVAPASDVGMMQSAVVVSRFPLMALMLVQSLLVPVFARRGSLYRPSDRRAILTILILTLPVTFGVAYLVGPALLELIYGQEYSIQRGQIALLTLGAAALGGMQVLIALSVSGDHHGVALYAFVPAVLLTAGVALLGALPLDLRVPVAMAAGPLVGVVAALVATSIHGRQRGMDSNEA